MVLGRRRVLETRGGVEVRQRAGLPAAQAQVLVPESSWLRADRPELRIVDQRLWDAAHDRLDRSRELLYTRHGGKIIARGKLESGLASKYLLSGFLVCAKCGGKMMVQKPTRRGMRGRPVVDYVCSNWRTRAGACSVKAHLPATYAHDRVVKMFLDQILTPEKLQDAVDALVARGNQTDVIAAQRAPLQARVTQLGTEIGSLTYQESYGAWESDLITTARNTGLDSSQVSGLRDAAIALGQEVGYRGRPATDDQLVAVFNRFKVPARARADLMKLWRQIEGAPG